MPNATNNPMNKAIVTYASLDDMKDAELRQWQALPAYERLRAVAEMTLAAADHPNIKVGSADDERTSTTGVISDASRS